MRRSSANVLALDFGGTKLATAIADPGTFELINKVEIPTPSTAEASLELMLTTAERLLDVSGGTISAVGVSFGGHVDAAEGVVRRSVQVPGWEGVPLASTLARHFGVSVRVRNDGVAGAVGEWATGAGRGLTDLVYLTVSTGIGGGLIVDGRPLEGFRGLAAEFGHLPVRGALGGCSCGLIGCVETVASGPAIAHAAARRIAEGAETVLAESSTAADISRAAASGDALSIELLADAGRALGSTVGAIYATVDPQAVIIGGGVSGAGAAFWDALLAAARPPFAQERTVKVLHAKNWRDAPLRGAAALTCDK